MRLTKAQLKIVEELHNQGWIWVCGGKPYLARKDKEGRVKSEPMHAKVFNTMVEHGVIVKTGNQWGLA